ncbi:MAG: ABC transporter substrate-binding protein [Halobacteriales archaeon]
MSLKTDRRRYLQGIGLAGVTGLAGCLGNLGGGGGRGDIMLGILMGVTGGLEQLGPPIRDSAQLAVQQVNDADVDFTIDSQFEDTQTDPNAGISAAESLSSSGYPMIAGALSSTVTIQVAKNVTIPNEIVQMSPASTSPAITDLDDNDFVWRTTPTDALQAQVMANIAINRLGASTTSTFALNNDYGQGLAQAYAKAFKNKGGQVLAEVSFEPEQGSYTAPLSQAMADNPDVLMIVGYPASGVQIFRDFYANYDPSATDILVPDGLKDSELPGNVGNPMSNVTGTAPLSTGPGRDAFESMYKEAYGASKVPFRAQSYDAAAVLMLANAAAGENDGPTVRDQVTSVAQDGGTKVTASNLPEGLEMAANGDNINYQGAAGSITFDDAGDIAAATYEYYGYGEQGLHTIDTIRYSK